MDDIFHGLAKSWTQLSQFHFHEDILALPKLLDKIR